MNMKKMKSFRLPVSTALMLGWLAASPLVHAQPQADTLRVRLNADIRSTDPGFNRDFNTDAVVTHVVEGLVAYREDSSVGPLLAQSVATSDDGRTYTFKLRQGIKFQNGAPLTADDVVFAWKRYMTPANNWRCLQEFDGRGLSKVVKVEAPDPSTVVYTLEKSSALFLATLARVDCGGTGIYHRSSLDADGKWREPVGTGPYKFSEWKRGQYIELVRNDAYKSIEGARDGNTGAKKAVISKVRFMIVPDSSAAKAALMSGAIDLNFNVNDEDIAEYKKQKNLTLETTSTMGVQGVLFQTQDPLLKDVRIRQAIALSIDMPELVSTVTASMAKPSRSVIPTASPYYKAAEAAVPARNIEQAKKLLAQAGYRGQPIKLLATKQYESVYNIALITQAMAQEAGINMEVEVLDWATLLDRYNKGNYQAMAFTYSARLDPSLSYEMVTGPKDKQPRKVLDDAQAQSLLDKSMQVADKAERQAIFDQLEARMRDVVPAVFMYAATNTSAAAANVKDYKGWPLGTPRAWGVSFRSAP